MIPPRPGPKPRPKTTIIPSLLGHAENMTLPHCNGTLVQLSHNLEATKYLPNQHLFIGVFFIAYFWLSIVPQFFLFYTCLEKQNRSESCYKLMFLTSANDIVNLVNCMLAAGIFAVFGIQHCRYGIWITYYGQFVMYFWYSYCITNLVLAFNRLLEFVNRDFCRMLFGGIRTWFWIFPIVLYSACLCVFSPDPFYIFDANAAVWYFFWLGKDSTNHFHIYNNLVKLFLMIVCYCIMLILLRKQIHRVDDGSSHVTHMEKKLSIQACIIASACAAGNITYLVISYLPMGNSPISGSVGEFLWGVQHSAAGFVYITMNKAVRRNFLRFCKKLGMNSSIGNTTLTTIVHVSK
ncbi:hypothetical protein L596_019202 [Steinernema carpocapsae]|uniref:G-protein coupled receptors family 1 profile domain-containing protein n=1 Tax=Steinernema carpocapsae TaxID=34508 RepID=A0A4U5MPL1_STECR|nr:hypothetical protein L596_019202 [Steinernema carpocapsae]